MAKNKGKQIGTTPETVIAALGMALVIIPVVFYLMLYSGLQEERDRVEHQIVQTQNELVELRETEAQIEYYKKQQQQLEASLKLIRARIPSTENELNLFFDSVNQRARTANIERWVTFRQDGNVSRGEYSAIPIKMEFEADYRAALRFFWELATMGDGSGASDQEQIINIRDVEIVRQIDSGTREAIVKVNCIAETYLYTGVGSVAPTGKGQ